MQRTPNPKKKTKIISEKENSDSEKSENGTTLKKMDLISKKAIALFLKNKINKKNAFNIEFPDASKIKEVEGFLKRHSKPEKLEKNRLQFKCRDKDI